MKFPAKLEFLRVIPPLTRPRMFLALAVAVVADGLQILLGPLGWLFADQLIDAVAMLLTMRILGFHILLLPTFVVELVPLVDDFPTWIACVIAVIALRKRGQPPALPDQVPANKLMDDTNPVPADGVARDTAKSRPGCPERLDRSSGSSEECR